MRRILILVGVFTLILLGAAIWRSSSRSGKDKIVLSGRIEADQIRVGSKIGGRVAQVLVEEGQLVRSGQLLVLLETADLEARSKEAEAAVRQAEANLRKLRRGFRPEEIAQARAAAERARENLQMLRRGPRQEEIEAARAELDGAEAELKYAEADFRRIESLYERGAVSRMEYDRALTAKRRAQAARQAASQRLELLLAGTRPEEIRAAEKRYMEALALLQLYERGYRAEDIAAAQAELERAQAKLETIKTQLAECQVRAPADAIVEVIDVRPGDLVAPNAPLAILIEPDRLWVRAYVPETELGHVSLNKPVDITVDSFPGHKFRGFVEQIAKEGEFTPRNIQTPQERAHQVFALKIRVKNQEGLLRAGMAADVIIARANR